MSVRKDIETAPEAEWAIASKRAKVMDGLLSQRNKGIPSCAKCQDSTDSGIFLPIEE